MRIVLEGEYASPASRELVSASGHGLPEDFFAADISDLRCRIGSSGEELDTKIIGQE
jgi:hypothetical protein